jgi:drug/metabolite transporter (DMT)-like permease
VPGDLWIVAASVAWAAYALLQKKWHSPLGSTARLATICMGGVAVLLPFALVELALPSTPVLGLEGVGLILLTALVPGLAAYWIYGWTQKILGASRVAVTLYLGPLYAGISAWLLLGEPLGMHHVAGGVLILSGVALVMAAKRSV